MNVPADIVSAIIEDLASRKGIGDEWEMLDDEMVREIKNEWISIVVCHL